MKYQLIIVPLLASSLLAQSMGPTGARVASCSPGNMTGAAPELVEKVDRFLKSLQSALSANDSARVALLMNYPIIAATGNKLVRIETKEEFVREYSQIFTPHLRELVMQQKAGCINLMDEKGFMLASGEIWFNEYPGGRLLISTINPPVPRGDKPGS